MFWFTAYQFYDEQQQAVFSTTTLIGDGFWHRPIRQVPRVSPVGWAPKRRRKYLAVI